MILAKVKVEYTGGLTLTDRVAVDPTTGELHLPPRLISIMATMNGSECTPAVSLEYLGHVLTVRFGSDDKFTVKLPETAPPGVLRVLHSIIYPTKDQRQQNGRLLHTLAGASVVGAVGYAHAAARWDWATVINTATLAGIGVILWYQGFSAMKGD